MSAAQEGPHSPRRAWLQLSVFALALITSALRLAYGHWLIEPGASVASLFSQELVVGALRVWLPWGLLLGAALTLAIVAARALTRRAASDLVVDATSVAILVWLTARSLATIPRAGHPDLAETYRIDVFCLAWLTVSALALFLVALRYRALPPLSLGIWLAVDALQGFLANAALDEVLGKRPASLASLATASKWSLLLASAALLGGAAFSFARSLRHGSGLRIRQWLLLFVAAWLGSVPMHARTGLAARASSLRFQAASQALQVTPAPAQRGRTWIPLAFAILSRTGEVWLAEHDRYARVPAGRPLPTLASAELTLFVDHGARLSDLDAMTARVPRGIKMALGRVASAQVTPEARAQFAAVQAAAVGLDTLRIYRQGDYIPSHVMREGEPAPRASHGLALRDRELLMHALPSDIDYLLTASPPAPASKGKWRVVPAVELAPPAPLGADVASLVAITSLLAIAIHLLMGRKAP